MKKRKYDVNPTDYIVVCPKLAQPISIPVSNCEGCGYHGAVIRIGKPVSDEKGFIHKIDDEKISASKIVLQPNKEGVMDAHVIVCNFPRYLKTSVIGSISPEEVA